MSGKFKARIRMYRQGIGDCLLVQLPRADSDQPFRMLIDCGVVLGTPDATNIMGRVVDNIQLATGGDPDNGEPGTIDLLIVTHEHWDHVSGFNQVPDWDSRFDVKRVWAGWTENPEDEQANKLDKAKKLALAALNNAAMRLGATGNRQAAVINEMLAFFGMGPAAAQELLGARATTRGGRDKALALAGDNLEYLDPGGVPRRLDGVENTRIFILGPPRNKKLLKKHAPSGTHPETYGFGDDESGMISVGILESAIHDSNGGPFSASFEIPANEAENVAFFQERYFNALLPDVADPVDEAIRDESWRKIGNEWGDVAVDLAMKLDSATNNTSLALAIELEPGGDVLLFPADAQVGNWLSWHQVEWSGDGAGKTARDLLAQTRFYKVGHHGSHNATLKEKGLEMMTHPGLIAMVPVNHEVAVAKKWTEMPLAELIDRLKEQTRGRLLLADDKTFPAKPRGIKKPVWEAFTKKVSIPPANGPHADLYFEVEI
jgi:hypothetical protein